MSVIAQAQEILTRLIFHAPMYHKGGMVGVKFRSVGSACGEVLVIMVSRTAAFQPGKHWSGIDKPSLWLHSLPLSAVVARRSQAILALMANHCRDAMKRHQFLHIGLSPAGRAGWVPTQEAAQRSNLQAIQAENNS